MNADFFASLTELNRQLLIPVQKMGSIAIAHWEKVIQFQRASLEKYAELGITQCKAALQVDDPKRFVEYAATHLAPMNEVCQQIIVDIKRAQFLGVEFLSQAQRLAQENVAPVAQMGREKVAA